MLQANVLFQKEHCGETPSRQIVFCNKDNTFYSVIVAMFINVHPIIVVVNDDCSVSYAVTNVLDARCRDHIILHVDQFNHQSINHLFSNAGLQSGSHKADVDLQRTNEM